MSEVVKKSVSKKDTYLYVFDVFDETSNKELSLNSITRLGEIGDKRNITMKEDGVKTTHVIEIRNIRQYNN